MVHKADKGSFIMNLHFMLKSLSVTNIVSPDFNANIPESNSSFMFPVTHITAVQSKLVDLKAELKAEAVIV